MKISEEKLDILESCIKNNINSPYATCSEKIKLEESTKLSHCYINTWLSNKRKMKKKIEKTSNLSNLTK